ncbi:MAG: hypothetical protein JWL70_855 [Acidimicrobiia bacterium]|nr:hypothetical protein [Acidimicrobiia bacterium]
MSDFSRDELRRSLRDLDALQREVMPRWRVALQRIFGDPKSSINPAAAREAATIGGLSRRRLLTVGGFSVATSAVLAACGKDHSLDPKVVPVAGEQSKVSPAPERTIDDIVLLRTASSVEYVAIDVYQAALDNGFLTGDLAAAARLFQGQHREHAALFEQTTREIGGEAFTTRNQAVWDNVVTPALKGGTVAGKEVKPVLIDTKGAVIFAHSLENVAASTYQSMVPILTQAALRQTVMTVGTVEARHAAVLAHVIAASKYIAGSGMVPPSAAATAAAAAAPTTVAATTTTVAGGSDAVPVKVDPVYEVPGAFGSLVEALGPNSYEYYAKPDASTTTIGSNSNLAPTSTTTPGASGPAGGLRNPAATSTTAPGTATPSTSNTTRPNTSTTKPGPTPTSLA